MDNTLHIKICGITNVVDAEVALRLGADYIGFIFYPPSPRSINADIAADILESLRSKKLEPKAIGVFVNSSSEEINHIIEKLGLWGVQLHGDEDPQFCTRIKSDYIIKAFRIKEGKSPEGLEKYDVFAFLFDTYKKGLYGGTGVTFDLRAVKKIIPQYKVFIAGGINSENIIEVAQTHPYCIDVSSGVESEPGRKDPEKLKELFKNIQKVKLS